MPKTFSDICHIFFLEDSSRAGCFKNRQSLSMFALKLGPGVIWCWSWCWCNPVSSFNSQARSKIKKTLDDDDNGYDNDDDNVDVDCLVRLKIK